VVALVLVVLVAVRAAAEPAEGAPKTRKVVDAYRSGSVSITVERFEPAAEGKYPAILLLHAVDGLEKPYGEQYRSAAQRFAEKGYVVLLVHYFDRTGADAKTVQDVSETFLRFAKGGDVTEQEHQAIREHFSAWTETVRDGVAYARKLPNVDSQRVGLVGFSMGAYLSLAVATQEDLHLAAVVELFGALPDGMEVKVEQPPPTLIIHGDSDQVVKVQKAGELDRMLVAQKVPDEVRIYKGIGHVFLDDNGAVTLKAMLAALDAEQHTALFLDKYLKGEATSRGGK
jgi:dienelactone hydrolase